MILRESCVPTKDDLIRLKISIDSIHRVRATTCVAPPSLSSPVETFQASMVPSPATFSPGALQSNAFARLEPSICIFCALTRARIRPRATVPRKTSHHAARGGKELPPRFRKETAPRVRVPYTSFQTKTNGRWYEETISGKPGFGSWSPPKFRESALRTPASLPRAGIRSNNRDQRPSRPARSTSSRYDRPWLGGVDEAWSAPRKPSAVLNLGSVPPWTDVLDRPVKPAVEDAEALLERRSSTLRGRLQDALKARAPELDRSVIDGYWNSYVDLVRRTIDGPQGRVPTISQLQDSLIMSYPFARGFDELLERGFIEYALCDRTIQANQEGLSRLADLRHPMEHYPRSREIRRKFHLHVGPTNSGKTYQALQALRKAQHGVYAAPLRLLAHEIYTRLNAAGTPCDLITGEEQRRAGETPAGLTSCTIEMTNLGKDLDVAVIDEIQMMTDPDRGWAWTQAVLAVRAREVHLCGEARMVPIIKALCAYMDSELEVHHYERLSPLKVAEESLKGDLTKLEKGDCFVTFSRRSIQMFKTQIEQLTGKRCAVIYGALPPESRAEQARLFNEPNNDYDFLVASDAVGMGLNLSIGRVIFEALWKFDGIEAGLLPTPLVKQIAGRAGRYRVFTAADAQSVSSTGEGSEQQPVSSTNERRAETPERNVGFATTFEELDLPYLQKAMEEELLPVEKVCLSPTVGVLERYALYFSAGTPWASIRQSFDEQARVHPLFFLSSTRTELMYSSFLVNIDGLSVEDKYNLCQVPLSKTEVEGLLTQFGKAIGGRTPISLLDMKHVPLHMLDDADPTVERMDPRSRLMSVELLHRTALSFLWLQFRYPNILIDREVATHIKKLAESKIDELLHKIRGLGRKESTKGRSRGAGEIVLGEEDTSTLNDVHIDLSQFKLNPDHHPAAALASIREGHLRQPPEKVQKVLFDANMEMKEKRRRQRHETSAAGESALNLGASELSPPQHMAAAAAG